MKKLENAPRSNKNHPRYVDLDGQRFGKLIVLESDLPDRKVLVRCDCGKEFATDKSSVISKHTTSCGKGLCHPNTKNLTGLTFGYLTVIQFLESRTDHSYGTLWECLCVCGKTHNVVSHSLVTGQTKSCGCKSGIMYSEKVTKPDNYAAIHSIYLSYQNHAAKLKIDFLLSKEDFEKLIQSNCHYCDGALSNTFSSKNLTNSGEYKYNGIDRKDSSLGYDINNCVTACADCNYAKRKLSYDEFIALDPEFSVDCPICNRKVVLDNEDLPQIVMTNARETNKR